MINLSSTLKDIISFDWLLKARTDSFAILLILTPPIYFLWILKIGMYTANRQGKSYVFFIISVFLVLLCALIFVLFVEQFSTLTVQVLIGIIFLSWLYACIFAAMMVVKYEFRNKDELPEVMDYIHTFGQIQYWILGIWVLQPKLNGFMDNP